MILRDMASGLGGSCNFLNGVVVSRYISRWLEEGLKQLSGDDCSWPST